MNSTREGVKKEVAAEGRERARFGRVPTFRLSELGIELSRNWQCFGGGALVSVVRSCIEH